MVKYLTVKSHGVETIAVDGEGKYFSLKKIQITLTSCVLTGIPLTNNLQYSQFTYIFSFQEEKESCALLSQVKIYDAKRLKRKIGIIDNDSFKSLKDKLKILLKL